MNGYLDRIVEYFHFDEPAIRLTATSVSAQAAGQTTAPTPAGSAGESAASTRRRVARDARAADRPRPRWDDLVLPAAQVETLRQIAIHVRQRAVVNDRWGFAAKHARGLGPDRRCSPAAAAPARRWPPRSSPPSSTSTCTRSTSPSVVSKYIGETEKNLRAIFDGAEESGAILLFDEADALFGKRSEVRDSHDRYANLEISYLLQRMEAYRGVAILTTNMKHALDPAFLRRIRFVVQFPFPDAGARARIWRGIFPAQPRRVADLDFERLAQLNVSGGVIRNIAMHAAFLAADDSGRRRRPRPASWPPRGPSTPSSTSRSPRRRREA